MVRLEGKTIYLAALEKEHCRQLWKDFEYDFEALTEILHIGHDISKAEDWFQEIQRDQGEKHVRLGIFLHGGTVVGDVALQDIDWKNRSCSLGLGFSRKEYRGRGYGTEAAGLILGYGFNNLGLERITASTLEQNEGALRVLEKLRFILEGRERKAVYFAGKRWDRLNHALLREEYNESPSP